MSAGLRQYVETADLDDDDVFAAVVQLATRELSMTDRDLAALMRISRPTAARWMNGVTCPHVAMRAAVRRGLLKKIAEREAAT